MAVDPSGNVWVSWKKLQSGSIAEFSDTGSVIKSFETERGFEPGLAVGSSENTYQVTGDGNVSEFDPTTGAETAEFGESVSGLTVDPAENDVYVDERGGKVAQYGPAQELIQEFGSEQLTDAGGGGLAIDSSGGTVYVVDSKSDDVIAESEGPKPEAPVTGTEAAEPVEATRETLHGELNPGASTEKVAYYFAYSYSAGAKCTESGLTAPAEPFPEAAGNHIKVTTTALHLEASSEYTYCLVAKGTFGSTQGNEATFTTVAAIEPEEPTGLEANPIAATTATLKGVLNPNAPGNFGTYEFIYSQSAESCRGENQKEVEGSATGAKSEPVQASVSELLPNMPYTFCLRARNEAHERSLAGPVTFTTRAGPPAIERESVSTVEAGAATLEAEIVPEGAATTYQFEYLTAAQFEADGDTFGAGTETTPQSASIGAEDTAHAVTARVTGLQSGTTYHYRVIAENQIETKIGLGKTFTTNPGSTSPPSCANEQRRAEQPYGLGLPDCRAYELVSPTDANGSDATDSFDRTGARASLSGEAVTYASKVSFSDPAGADYENQVLSRRGPGAGRRSRSYFHT